MNDSASITRDNTINYLTDVAVIGDTYIGELYIYNLSIINGAKVETLDRVYYNNLDITGGELQADNDLQVGKAKTTEFSRHLAVNSKHKDVAEYFLPVKGIKALPKQILLASLTPVSTNDASVMTDAGTEISRQHAVDS